MDCDRVPQIVLSAAPGASALSASEEILPGKFRPSTFYDYTAFLDAVANVPTVVAANAGVGKISTTEYDAPTSVSHRPSSPFSASLQGGRLIVQAPAGTAVEVLSARGALLHRQMSNGTSTVIPLNRRSSGLLVVRAGGDVAKVVSAP